MRRRPTLTLHTAVLAAATALAAGSASSQGAAKAPPAKAASSGGAQVPRFQVAMLWPKPMQDHWILGSSVGVAVDAQDHVFVLNIGDAFNARTEIGAAANPPTGECCSPAPSVLEFDASGAAVGHWGGPGAGYAWPQQPSGIAVDKQGNVWIGGSGPNDTQILKFSHDGKFLMAAGKAVAPPAAPAPAAAPDTAYQGMSGAARGAGGGRGAAGAAPAGRGRGRGGRGGPPPTQPNSSGTESFGGATRISFDNAANEAFVADGSRNHRVAVIDMNTGAIKRIWGAYGKPPTDAPNSAYSADGPASQQFGNPVLCAEVSADGLVYVCDRTNDRIQVFRKDGSFVKEATVMPKTMREGSVWDIAFSRDAKQKYLYVADGMNNQVHVLDRATLSIVESFGDGGRVPGEFFALHSIATDSKGNIYTTETYEGKRVQKFTYMGLGAANAKAVAWPAAAGGKP
jgi:DNA-binding beta-propeller fold protein YncE